MSGKNNVNPDHYKVAGRDKQDDVARARREGASPTGKSQKKKREPAPNFIPGAAPVHETPAPADDSEEQADRR